VKGNCFQASAGDAIFGNGSYQDGSTRRFSGDATPSRENGGFFSLGRMIAITDNTSLQRLPFGRIGCVIDFAGGKKA
jgi:hypothetical protein